ncbi:HORMA-1 domain-containing protein [Bythopirellula goksoeyrii]|uniref:Bacterial HORMA domain-containing protein n=1 Tax=Bythopirellula goksoeyrii TaxID=1400387 RepID=A0A5B9QPA4_9BACT|nr:hypothetical protein [Bythopirellula goksoeyrii]QEG35823.1 hypothetical protein Pr1d_31290 [Bythopirellula goksoeyrii]
MSTYTYTQSSTFTVTHAKHLASKIAADLNACSRLHGQPAISSVKSYNEELIELLRNGYLSRYEFGFKCDDKRVLSWSYDITPAGNIETDDRAGKMSAYVDLSGTTFFNYVWYSGKYHGMNSDQQATFKGTHPINRTPGDPPADGVGYWTGTEKNYSAGGTEVSRRSFRSY